jgi:hypothetical protein
MTSDFIPAIERIYRELARPEALSLKLTLTEPAKLPELNRDDVQAILRRTRFASSEQLQSVITNFKEYGLTINERDQLSVDLTIQLAQARQTRDRRESPNDRFIARVLSLAETPFGLVDRSFAEGLLRAGSQNIYHCTKHQPPRCNCWCAQRVYMSQILGERGEKSPEGWAAMRVYALLEELECSARTKTHASIG